MAWRAALAVVFLGSTGCNGGTDTVTPDVTLDEGETLFQTLGGEASLHAIVDQIIDHVEDDAAINGLFANTDMAAFENSFYDFVCEKAGGPCTYGGPDMA